jgi:hypothetical protein
LADSANDFGKDLQSDLGTYMDKLMDIQTSYIKDLFSGSDDAMSTLEKVIKDGASEMNPRRYLVALFPGTLTLYFPFTSGRLECGQLGRHKAGS